MDLHDVRIRASGADQVLDTLYPGQQPFFFVAPARWCDGGPDPLSGVSVFSHADGHLHYVGHGLRDAAGFSFELTFRLAITLARGSPERGGSAVIELPAPAWPVRLMNEFARHAIKAKRPFGPGHYLCLPEAVGAVRCGALVPDPQLARAEADPEWLQIVGLREDELSVISEQGYDGFLCALAHRAPLFVTA
jgi:hypothetical protein